NDDRGTPGEARSCRATVSPRVGAIRSGYRFRCSTSSWSVCSWNGLPSALGTLKPNQYCHESTSISTLQPLTAPGRDSWLCASVLSMSQRSFGFWLVSWPGDRDAGVVFGADDLRGGQCFCRGVVGPYRDGGSGSVSLVAVPVADLVGQRCGERVGVG